jgi:two-component system, NarL family, sensor histidine kinase BarA
MKEPELSESPEGAVAKAAATDAQVPGFRPRAESVLQRRLRLNDLLDVGSFSELVKSFVELYQVGVKVFDDRGNRLADVKVGSGDLCAYVFSFPDGRSRCTATVGRVKDGPVATEQGARQAQLDEGLPLRGMVAIPCFTGLRYLVMPILWEGDVLGRVIFGPFVPEDLAALPQSLLEIAQNFSAERAQPLLASIRRAPESTVGRVMLHFSQLLDALVSAGQRTYLTSQLHIEATLDTNRQLELQNRRLEAANVRLKDLDRLKSSFLATVSHELRTPLTSIIGYSEMLSEGLAGPLNPEQLEYTRTIMDKGETLLKLISSILDLSQIEAGKVRLTFAPHDLVDIVLSSISSVKPQANKKGIVLETRVPDRPQGTVRVDADKLRQVVVNLLANAVKFTPENGKVSVYLSDIADQPELAVPGYRIIVEDTGVGIPREQYEQIFESFYQVDSSSTREFGGAGLGLAIVKSFVEGHGGVIRIASEIGRGSRLTAVLPVNPPDPRGAHIPPPVKNRF